MKYQKQLIDTYWENQIIDEVLLKNIKRILEDNESKIIKNNDFTTVLKQKYGKRRLDVLDKVIRLIKNK